jgi:hypothetical protein
LASINFNTSRRKGNVLCPGPISSFAPEEWAQQERVGREAVDIGFALKKVQIVSWKPGHDQMGQSGIKANDLSDLQGWVVRIRQSGCLKAQENLAERGIRIAGAY